MGGFLTSYWYPTDDDDGEDRENTPTLRALIARGDWGLAKQRLLDHPEQASLYAHFVEDSILVNAIEARAPDALLEEILEAYPDAIFHSVGGNNDDIAVPEESMIGGLPLHVACRCGTSLDFVKVLVEYHPNSVRETLRDGTLAVHHTQNARVAQFLIDQYPESVSHADLQGRIPLHYCMISIRDHQNLTFTFDLVRVLVENNFDDDYKSGILRADSQGSTPLDLLCQQIASVNKNSNRDCLWEIFRYLTSKVDESLSSASILHSIIKLRLPILKQAIQKFPEQLGERDSRGQTPLFVASGMKMKKVTTVGDNNDTDPSENDSNTQQNIITDWVDVIRSLLEAYPVAARMTDLDGRLPIDIAAERQNDERILKLLVRAEPRAVETRDLRDKLFPFLAAARTSNLGAIYRLLREKPHVLECLRRNNGSSSSEEAETTVT